MNILSLNLKNFRNYTEEEITFNPGINVLTGENAQGKTNAGEAIFFACTGYSPRANKDKLVIKNGEDKGEVTATADSVYGKVSVKIEFNKNDKKSVYINGVQVLKIGELLGNIHSVFFNPADLKLVQETPEDRRRFMNISISQMSKNYFYALQRYNKILSQRNNLLKDPRKDVVYQTLPIWDEQLCKEAGKIIRARKDFLSDLAPIAEIKHAFITDGKEFLKMRTESAYDGDEKEIAKAMYLDLKENIDKDIHLGFTTIGPHRDDVKFTLNGLDVRVYGSQGQQRTVALSLKLAEVETFKARFGEYPVLILDDVLSELDKNRQKKLISAVSNYQTIFTAVNLDRTLFKGYPYTKTIIENGRVKSQKIFNVPKVEN